MNSTQKLTSDINNNKACIFVKYGDGEYYAATYQKGENCDNTPYTKNLGDKVRESFVYISAQNNSMLGLWHDEKTKGFWNDLVNTEVNWVDYHTVLIDGEKIRNTDTLDLFRSIKESTRKKIYIANEKMNRAKDVFLIDSHVKIHPSNWFENEYDTVFNSIKSEITDDNNIMILTSAGMGAKYLIAELHKLYPNAIYIDIGSGFDKICTGAQTRTYNPSFHHLYTYLFPILPKGY
jgi:hypothetical protein